jgi:hypothetical protein
MVAALGILEQRVGTGHDRHYLRYGRNLARLPPRGHDGRMPIRVFTCSNGHTFERILFGKLDKAIHKSPCPECQEMAPLNVITMPFVPSDDFATAMNYEKRKQQELPIK